MAKRLYVGNLAWSTTNESLQAFFAQAGQVVSAEVVMNRFDGRSKGFGFVEMATEEEAQKAVAELNRKELDGRMIFVNEARPPAPRTGGFGGDRGGDRGGYRNDRNRGGDRDNGYSN